MKEHRYENKSIYVALQPQHVADGLPNSWDTCAVALAFHAAVPEATHIIVGGGRLEFSVGDDNYSAYLPEKANNWIKWYDGFDTGQKAWDHLRYCAAPREPMLLAFDVQPKLC